MNELIIFRKSDLLKFSLLCLGVSCLIFSTLALCTSFGEVNEQAFRMIACLYELALGSDFLNNFTGHEEIPSYTFK